MPKLLSRLILALGLTLLTAACSDDVQILTPAERSWTASHTITVAPDPSWPPVEFIDTAGQHRGIAADYLELIAMRTGLRYKVVSLPSWDAVIQHAERGQIDLFVGIYTTERAKRYIFSRSFIEFPCVVIINEQDRGQFNLRQAHEIFIIKGHAIENHLRSHYPNLRIRYVKNTAEGLRLISFSRGNAFAIDLPSASYEMDRQGLSNLKIGAELNYSYQLRFICNRSKPILRDILDKGLSSITPQQQRRIWYRWISLERRSTALYRRMLIVTLGIIVLALLLTLAVLAWNRMLRRQVSERTAELNENRSRLIMALKGADLTTWDIWPATGEITLSTNADQPPGKIDINTWLERIHPDDLPGVSARLQAHIDGTNDYYECEYRLKVSAEQLKNNAVEQWVKDSADQWRWVRARGRITERSLNGAPRRISGTLLDIDQTRQAEEASHLLAQVIEQTAEAVAVTSAEFKIEYFNPTLQRTLGYAPEELSGHELFELMQDSALRRRQITAALAANNLYHGRLSLKRKPQGQVVVEATISPMLDTKGTAIRYIIVMRDITHELDLERQLQQAHKMEALGTLAGGIAHDFNNILTPIIGYAEICREEATSESQREYLDEILKAATRARDMVSHIQIFSRQPSQETVIIKLQPLINEAIKLIRASIPSSIIIQSDISPECGPVLANPDQIQQIVMNLCTNAYHAMELGGGTLNIELKRLPAQSTQAARLICLRVSDTGCGIDPAIIDRIFDPYFTTKEIGKGSGMGLAIVHGIVERAGGTIRVESTPGLGSSFEVILPEASTETVQSDNHSAGDTELTGNERILLADDEAAIARLVKQILSKLGYSVTEATSGQEALAIFKQSPQAFDLLITDMAMPGMTGTALIKAVHAIRADLPVIVCSGFSEENDLNQAEASGIKAVIMKPIVKNELLQAVRRALD